MSPIIKRILPASYLELETALEVEPNSSIGSDLDIKYNTDVPPNPPIKAKTTNLESKAEVGLGTGLTTRTVWKAALPKRVENDLSMSGNSDRMLPLCDILLTCRNLSLGKRFSRRIILFYFGAFFSWFGQQCFVSIDVDVDDAADGKTTFSETSFSSSLCTYVIISFSLFQWYSLSLSLSLYAIISVSVILSFFLYFSISLILYIPFSSSF